jgi:hypothetical protein
MARYFKGAIFAVGKRKLRSKIKFYYFIHDASILLYYGCFVFSQGASPTAQAKKRNHPKRRTTQEVLLQVDFSQKWQNENIRSIPYA